MELNELLSNTADHIVADGTQVESLTLHVMATASGELNRGAAAALVDWDGSEIARLRAFGIVHGLLLRELPASSQAELFTHLLGTSSALVLDPAPLPAAAPAPVRPARIFRWRQGRPMLAETLPGTRRI